MNWVCVCMITRHFWTDRRLASFFIFRIVTLDFSSFLINFISRRFRGQNFFVINNVNLNTLVVLEIKVKVLYFLNFWHIYRNKLVKKYSVHLIEKLEKEDDFLVSGFYSMSLKLTL